jgi:hypothetical protein
MGRTERREAMRIQQLIQKLQELNKPEAEILLKGRVEININEEEKDFSILFDELEISDHHPKQITFFLW